MFHRLINRTACVGAWGAAILFISTAASSDATKPELSAKQKKERKVCVTNYRNAVEFERQGHLRQAKDTMQACMKNTCSAGVRQKCRARINQLDAEMPSVVPAATNEAGEPRVDVMVSIDGEVVTSRLDGRPIPVDPGVHEFAFTADGVLLGTQKVEIAQGQQNRPITMASGNKAAAKKAPDAVAAAAPEAADKGADKAKVEVAGADRAAPERETADRSGGDREFRDVGSIDLHSSRGVSPGPFILAGIGLAGVGGYGLLTYWGRKDNDKLAQCAPNCSQASIDHIQKLYFGADISLGFGAAALAGAATWFIVDRATSSGSSERTAAGPKYTVDVHPSKSGAFASVSGTF